MFDDQKKIIKESAEKAGNSPGVYKMINSAGKVIYVGKAKNLNKRLVSYTRFDKMSDRSKMLINSINKIEFIITNSEIDALLLESNLIKEIRPFFNVLLKDDKSYPYIVIDEKTEFPRIHKYRSHKGKHNSNFYGPYPLVSALDEALKVIQKAFLIRNCTDNFFNARKRPCIQYFIKRCTAPCVKRISADEYQKNVKLARDLLEGNDSRARDMLVREMNEASKNLDFERAAVIRDRISAISEIQHKQYSEIDNHQSIDIVAHIGNIVNVTFFRNAKNVGTEIFEMDENLSEEPIVENFITQFYKNIRPPKVIVTNCKLPSKACISKLLNRVRIIDNPTSAYKKIIENSLRNIRICSNENEYKNEITRLCSMTNSTEIKRIEIYDNSHIMGTNACGAMVVFENGKLSPKLYRSFNIDKATANLGDDISMMKFVLSKRFRSERIPEKPDLLIIDGGHSQLNAALEICGDNNVIAIAKQNYRTIGDEKIILRSGQEIFLDKNDALLNFLIVLRNEAHRFAITFHRKKRSISLIHSELDDVPGIGPVRKKKLLEHFGSITAIKNAEIDDIIAVHGLDKKSASIVFDFFKGKRQ